MNFYKSKLSRPVVALVAILGLSLFASSAYAHCDLESGPVAVAAKQALKTDDVGKVLIWVSEEQEKELTATYRQAKAVYAKGGASKTLAEQYFMENSVRLHRLAEGMTYTGLKPVQAAPLVIRIAERSLETGDLAPTNDLLVGMMNEKVSHYFEQARAAQKQSNGDVASGREAMDAYVRYVTFVEHLHGTIEAGPTHGIEN